MSEQLKANPDTAHIPIHYDPGHIKKNFQKSLLAIYGTGVRYKGLAERGGYSDYVCTADELCLY